MSNLALFPDLARAREEAAEWLARIDRGLAPEESQALARWRANPANARAMAEMGTLWNDLDELKVLAEIFPTQPPAAAPAAATAAGGWRGGKARLAMAASLLLAVAAGALLLLRDTGGPGPAAPAPLPQQFATAIGEQRSIPLADGSVIALNTDSSVEVLLGEAARELHLRRGEAHFTVAHDAARPFRVSASGRIVQAVGTAFDVRLHQDGGIEVIVTEGIVKVLGEEAPLVEQLERGQSAWVAADGTLRIAQLEGEALNGRLAWRNGMLVFDGQTLAEAIGEFSRYSNERIVLTDPSLGRLRIGGFFPAGDTDALADALRGNFGLDVRRDADGSIRIGPGAAAAARPGRN